jgi:AraC family transcriptional regulator
MPSELPELVLERHFLILWEAHVAEGEAAYPGGRFSPYKKYPNTMTACHPGIRPAVRNRSSHEVIVASLQSGFVHSIEDELDKRPSGSFQILYGTDDPDLRNLLILLQKESAAGGPCGTLYAESLTTALVTRLVYAARLQSVPAKTTVSALPARVLRRVTERMHVGLSTNLDLLTLAAESGYSRVHFLRAFKATTGQTPHRYLNELRLQKARDLLSDYSLALVDVAAACGFSSHGHLTAAFHTRFGLPPSQFRRRQDKGQK